jgi:hypothetical protein
MFGVARPQSDAQKRRPAIAEEEAQTPADNGYREDDPRRGIPQIADTVSNENLINDVVQT